MFGWRAKQKEIKQLRELKQNVVFNYEFKKLKLLEAHRNESIETCKQLVFEINVLAELLKEEKVDASNISDTCIVYPDRICK